MLPFNWIMSVIIAVIMARVVYSDFGCRGVSVILHLVLLLCQRFAAPSKKPPLSISQDDILDRSILNPQGLHVRLEPPS